MIFMYAANLSGLCRRDSHHRLLTGKGHAVGALLNCGVGLMGADNDLVQRAIVLQIAVVCALTYGALDRLICMTAHIFHPPFLDYRNSMTDFLPATPSKKIQKQAKHRLLLIFKVFWKFFPQFPIQPSQPG